MIVSAFGAMWLAACDLWPVAIPNSEFRSTSIFACDCGARQLGRSCYKNRQAWTPNHIPAAKPQQLHDTSQI